MSGALYQALSLLRSITQPLPVLARLVAGEEVSVATRQLEDLVDLARAFREWPGAGPFLAGVGRESAGIAAWQAALPDPLWQGVRRWLAAWGHRRPHETDLALPRPAEDPRLLCDALAPLVSAGAPPGSSEEQQARRREECARAWGDLEKELGAFRRWRLRRAVRKVAALGALREELRSELMRESLLARGDVLELAGRLQARGQLAAVDQVFDLSIEELERAASDPGYDAASAARRERARQASWRRVEVPNRFTSGDVGAFQRSAPQASAGETFPGLAVSPGEVEARACVVRAPDDSAALLPGGVLVAYATDPAWTPLFARAAGIVVELGGLLSHAATVAREYGIPCVSNVEGATELLRDGDLVRVDGSRGVVSVVSRARPETLLP
jgi:pyruvate,water dikinase